MKHSANCKKSGKSAGKSSGESTLRHSRDLWGHGGWQGHGGWRGLDRLLAKGREFVSPISEEVQENFKAWYVRNFRNPRAGRIGHVSYARAGALDDHLRDGQTWYQEAYARSVSDYTASLEPEEIGFVLDHPLILTQLALGITDLYGLRCLRRGLTKQVNRCQRRAYRRRYYALENARRRRLAAERRRIRRRSTFAPCPTPEEFRRAFARVRESVEAKVRFGGLVHDLECHVDNCLRIDARGEIVGRNGGIRQWIADNVPELFTRYKTIMRYKALAKRIRQATDLRDPNPTSVLFENADIASRTLQGREVAATDVWRRAGTSENYSAVNSQGSAVRDAVSAREDMENGKNAQGDGGRSGDGGVGGADGEIKLPNWLKIAREKYRQLYDGCPNTMMAVFARVDAQLS